MAKPYQKANVPGPEVGTTVSDPVVMANILKTPKSKIMVLGAEALNWELDGKKVIDYYIEIAKKLGCEVIATEHAFKYLDGKLDAEKLSNLTLINTINRLADKEWKGPAENGPYQMAIFGGHIVYYVSQALSKLKNFTNWLRTVDLDKFAHPNARFSLPNLSDDDWKEFLETLIENL